MRVRIISILLIFCMIVPGGVTYLWLRQRRADVRREVKHQIMAGLEKDDLVHFHFTFDETRTKLFWKRNHEFSFDGKMYDIVERDTAGESIDFWCWLDKEETALNNQLNSLFTVVWGKDPIRKSQQDTFYHFYRSLFFVNNSPQPSLNEFASMLLPAYSFSSKTIQLAPPVPPPLNV